MNTLKEFRKDARRNGMPADAIEYWASLARPCLDLSEDGRGPVVGYFGGRPALPASVAWPAGHAHLASVDLAATPPGGTDLDLPASGTLVFFAVPGRTSTTGRVVHVPAGAEVTEAEPPAGVTVYDRFDLHAGRDRSLPESAADSPLYTNGEPRDDRELYEEIVGELEGQEGVMMLGGFGLANDGARRAPTGAGEVLLAEFFLDPDEVGDDFGTPYATVFFVAGRDDLAAGEFSGVRMVTDYERSETTIDEFREEAREQGMPADAIDYWVSLARPCLALGGGDTGPVAGWFGGRPALPADVEWPKGHAHLASVDLAALPADGTDLDLPAEGTLVFFAVPEMTSSEGRVVYLPPGAVLTEAEPPSEDTAVYRRCSLRVTRDWSLPEDADESPRYDAENPRDDQDEYEEISWDLSGPGGVLVLGGFGQSNTGGMRVPIRDHETEALLAEFFLDESRVDGTFETEYATVFFVSSREDLAARRFDAVQMSTDFQG